MLNTQMTVRCRLAGDIDRQQLMAGHVPRSGLIGEREPWIQVFNLGGALGSEYYSLSKDRWTAGPA